MSSRKLVFQLIQNGTLSNDVIKDHEDLFQDINTETPKSTSLVINPSHFAAQKEEVIKLPNDENKPIIHDIIHEEENSSLSIEEKEKELILKALRKHHNKRKYAAIDLGISERTLYRKIKQYKIEKQ